MCLGSHRSQKSRKITAQWPAPSFRTLWHPAELALCTLPGDGRGMPGNVAATGKAFVSGVGDRASERAFAGGEQEGPGQ